ncbi:MAG TPA: anion transporter [Clostridiaceae bacterium]|nr:anion transporter [Clostridiaceae bacterium]
MAHTRQLFLKTSNNTAHAQFITKLFINDPVFLISLILALLSCFWASPKIEYIDFKVLACLFNLMIVVKAFEELQLLDKFAVSIINRCTDSRKVSLVMILLSFFSSMVITNDISLITLVPLTLIISRKSGMNVLLTVVLQTLAANIGSSLTPIGNPQNLYIFSYYNLTASQFFASIILFAVLGLIWLCLLNFKNARLSLELSLSPIKTKDNNKICLWAVLFGVVILSVFEAVNYILVLLLTVTVTFFVNKKLFLKVDYPLLITFVCFFIFIGNISSIPAVTDFMKTNLNSFESTYFSSIILSQVISNVPCAVFLSKFSSYWRELLLGVNIGGMGTIIASLASVISYKLFIKENPECSREYIIKFSIYNIVSLALFTFINYFAIIRR